MKKIPSLIHQRLGQQRLIIVLPLCLLWEMVTPPQSLEIQITVVVAVMGWSILEISRARVEQQIDPEKEQAH